MLAAQQNRETLCGGVKRVTIRTIVGAAYAMDGGSIDVQVLDAEGAPHSVLLVQHRIPENSSPHKKLGRLYLDKELVEIRSATERKLLDELAEAEVAVSEAESNSASQSSRLVLGTDIEEFLDAVDESPEAATRHLVRRVSVKPRCSTNRHLSGLS